jgi:putative HD superfamily hydrolase of NAD metabolism
MDYAELCPLLEVRLNTELSPERAGHCRRVAALASELCEREGLEPQKGRAAGLAHDLCKERPKAEQRALAALYPGAGDPSSALMADKVVHGPAAAALLSRDYGLDDEELLEAIAVHTVGRPGMGSFSTIVYCADKLEPGRERPGGEFRRRCLELPLDDMLREVVRGVIDWMRTQGKDVAPETLVLYSFLSEKALHK